MTKESWGHFGRALLFLPPFLPSALMSGTLRLYLSSGYNKMRSFTTSSAHEYLPPNCDSTPQQHLIF